MKDGFIDLGTEGCLPSPCCAGSDAPKKHYPTLYFDSPEGIDFPEGEITVVIKGRKVMSKKEERDPENPRYCCEIEVHAIKPTGGAVAKKTAPDFKGALDKGMARKMGNVEEEGEY